MTVFELPSAEFLDQVHVEQRGKERYATDLTDDDRREMTAQCKDQRGIFLSRKNADRHVKIWLVWWPTARRVVPVYYDNRKGRVVSVLPWQSVQQIIARSFTTPTRNNEETSNG